MVLTSKSETLVIRRIYGSRNEIVTTVTVCWVLVGTDERRERERERGKRSKVANRSGNEGLGDEIAVFSLNRD